ncbi:MAG: DNA polymerase I [Candidatus Omnitrophota bacterium]
MSKENKNIYLIDGHALCYRAYYAIQNLSTSKGLPTNAIYGFINILRKLIKEYTPLMITIVFDTPVPTLRHKKYEQYKIQRNPMPDDLSWQIPKIKEIINAYGITTFELDGYEADDIIATLAVTAEKNGINVVIVTADKDALQLVNKNTIVLSPHTDKVKLYGIAEVKEKYGVEPEEMIDFMALMGDASDNIPGVRGIGRVTAGKLINEYGGLDKIYENINGISSVTLKNKLREGKDMARLSQDLVTLQKDVPIDFDVNKLKKGDLDTEKLSRIYKELEFEKLLREVMPKEEIKGKYFIKKEANELNEIYEAIKKNKKVSFAIDRSADGNGIKGITFSWKENEAYYVPADLSPEKKENFAERAEYIISEIFADETIEKIGYNIKEDIRIFRSFGIDIKGRFFDVMIADYLIDPARSKYDLESIAMRYLGYNLSPLEDSLKWDKNGQAALDLSPGKDKYKKECEKSDILFLLYKRLIPILKDKQVMSLFENVEMPLVKILAQMEMEGVGVDIDYLKRRSAVIGAKLKEVTGRIYELAEEEFNVNSPKQLQTVLYEKLKLPVFKKTKTGASTDESVLTKLASLHELPGALLEYREMNKLKTGYYDSILNLADRDNKKLYARFNQAVTATGRLSSSEPNLQNIPIKTKLGRELRRAFVSDEKGYVLLAADYSQVELRVLAHLSGDKKLLEAFNKDEDVHRFTAALIFDTEIKDVTAEMRSMAKTVNFGIIYGMSSFGLAKDLGMSIEEAQSFIDSYFERYDGIKRFIENTIKSARKNGFVTTLLNRRRYIPEINSSNQHLRNFAERTAVNTPVQGSAADLIKLAMIKCDNRYNNTDIKMIIQVHDELVFKIPENRLKIFAKEIKEIMESVIELKAPLKVDIEAGKNWLDMEEVK